MELGILGTSLDPGTNAHLEMLRVSSGLFDKVIVLPCGPRTDKTTVNDTPPHIRGIMTDILVRLTGLSNVFADLSDLELDLFTSAWDLEQRFSGQGTVWHIIGADIVRDIKSWKNGQQLLQQSHFLIFRRPGWTINPADLPLNHKIVESNIPVSSTDVRKLVTNRDPFKHLVPPEIAEVVKYYELYRSQPLKNVRPWQNKNPKFTIIGGVPESASNIITQLEGMFAPEYLATEYLVLGGDGKMITKAKSLWRHRKPFVGFNFGHVGFLYNEPPENFSEFLTGPLLLHECFLLRVEITHASGAVTEHLAFNDAYMKAVPTPEFDTTAWIEMLLPGEKPKHIMCDGMLVSTPAGSTAYAMAAGGDPFRINEPHLRIIGLNISRPRLWKSQMVNMDTEVVFNNLDTKGKRPVQAYIDGAVALPGSKPVSMKVRRSRVAVANILLGPGYDFEYKIKQLLTMPDFKIE